MMVTRGLKAGRNGEMLVKRYMLPVIRVTNSGDLRCSMVTIANTPVII